MKRLLSTALIALISAIPVFSQTSEEVLASFLSNMKEGRISAEFNLRTDMDKVPVTMKGTVLLQDRYFLIDCGQTRIFCDGESVWTVDNDAREVVIEPFDLGDDILTMLASSSRVETEKGKIKSIKARNQDGSELYLQLPSYELLPKGDVEDFRFDEKTVGKDFIITDLR